MLWVWPDPSPDGLAASRTTEPALMEGVEEEDMGYLVVAREMPYGFDTLLENGIGAWVGLDVFGVGVVGEVKRKGPIILCLTNISPPHTRTHTDPSHLPWAHHNIISHRSQAAFIDIQVDDIKREGFDSADFFPKRKQQQRAAVPTPETTAEEEAGLQGRNGGSRRAPPAMIPVAQSLHFRPPSLLYQVINVTEVSVNLHIVFTS